MTTYESVIGLEIHVELNTNSKMFCRCSADIFGKPPNTHTCPVCLGLPGALPYANQKAIEECIRIGLALNCQIAQRSLFERKNYFYPDLPKGYQVSQYRWPLCINGWLEVVTRTGAKNKVAVRRVHQEEDTGKLAHMDGETIIDFNRSGVPLVEIVTEPDFRGAEEVRDFAKALQQIFRYLGVSNADMEKGEMRLEANVSVRGVGEKELPGYRIELKNINSFKFMVAAIDYEVRRQIEALEKGEKLTHATRGWDEERKKTFPQREKEEAHDYRYFPDPDLPSLKISHQEVDDLKDTIPELPSQKAERFITRFDLNYAQTLILTESRRMADYFEEAARIGENEKIEPGEIANYIVNRKIDIESVKPGQLIKEISQKRAGIIESEEEIGKMVEEAMSENPEAVQDYKKGKTSAVQVLIGAVMQRSKGKASPTKVRELLEKKLKSED